MNKTRQQGILYAISAFSFWGLIPIYFMQVSHVSPLEVLVHRIIWSVVVLIILLQITKQYELLKPILKNLSQIKYLFLSSLLVSANWLIFIYGVSENKILETSLGYFINPLISVLLGYLLFSERLTKIQTVSVFIVFIAILLEIINMGTIPLISIGLATSFALYGVVRKKVQIASIPGLFIETLLLLPFALGYLIYLTNNDTSAFIQGDNYTTVMLCLGGIITVLPLLWFNASVTRIKLSTIGMLQYIGPSLSFLVAIYIYNEPLSSTKFFTFVLIWIALAIFSYDVFRKGK